MKIEPFRRVAIPLLAIESLNKFNLKVNRYKDFEPSPKKLVLKQKMSTVTLLA